MLELLSFVFGGIFRLIPELSRLWDGQKQREHELKMAQLQFDLDRQRGELLVEAVHTVGQIELDQRDADTWLEAIKAQAVKTGIKFVDGLNALVRPILTFWWCIILATAYKIASYHLMVVGGASWDNAITMLWTTTDYQIVLSIIGFWFVDRTLRKISGT